MTKHIRKEHPAEPVQDDQDAEYSDVEASDDEVLEDDTGNIKAEVDSPYPEDSKDLRLTRPLSNYHTNLWPLPAQTAQRPSPLQLQRPIVHRSESSCHEIKLERTSSGTPQRSLTDPYPETSIHSTGLDSVTIHPAIPHSLTTSTINQHMQFQYRNHDNSIGLWSPGHDSPTSIANSSPSSASTQGHSMYTSQPYQLQPTSLPSHAQMQYSQDGMMTTLQQPMNDLAVHDIQLDQPQQHQYQDMTSASIQQQQRYNALPRHISQPDHYVDMSRDPSQHTVYAEASPPTVAHHFQSDVPSTPAPNQTVPHYASSIPQEQPYQQPQFLPMETFTDNNLYYLPNSGFVQTYQSSYGLGEMKVEDKAGGLWAMPGDRVPAWNS